MVQQRSTPENDLKTAEELRLAKEAKLRSTALPTARLPYVMQTWKGYPRWQCRVPNRAGVPCPWDTLVERDYWLHFVARHRAEWSLK